MSDARILAEQLDKRSGQIGILLCDPPKDHPNASLMRTADTTVIEQQAEIERLREALAGVMDYAEEGALTIDTQPALDAAYAALGATQ